MSQFNDRTKALHALIADGPSIGALDALRVFPVSSSGPALVLTRENMRATLIAFADGLVEASLLERWAEAIHGADDVDLDPVDEEFLSEALFELSTPELFGPLEEVVTGLLAMD